jgi:hypothetical protein
VNPEVKTKWLTALRSGNYEQGKGALANNGRYCCLGVLCELAVQEGVTTREESGEFFSYDDARIFLPESVQAWAGVSDHMGGRLPEPVYDDEMDHLDTLIQLNDLGRSFAEIADVIEAQF